MLMGLAYWPIAAVALALAMGTLPREGRREVWFVLLGLLVIGGGLEILLNGPSGLVFEHGSARMPGLRDGPVRLPRGLGHRVGDRIQADLPAPAGSASILI
jgi:hypothetical protein